MPATLFGLPAVEIEQPNGEVILYLVRVVPTIGPQREEPRTRDHAGSPARPEEWRAWEVTSPKGDVYRVSEGVDGFFWCGCPAHNWSRQGAGRWCRVGSKAVCKHIAGVWHELVKPAEKTA